jgi:hypothetical protein
MAMCPVASHNAVAVRIVTAVSVVGGWLSAGTLACTLHGTSHTVDISCGNAGVVNQDWSAAAACFAVPQHLVCAIREGFADE